MGSAKDTNAGDEAPASPEGRTRVLLVDDHAMVRRGLAGLITEEPDLTVCGEAESPQQCLQLIATTRPQLAVVDLSLGNEHGIELIKEIHARYPLVLVLVLSMHDESIFAERALRAGAVGYVMKAAAAETVMTAIRRILAGKIYISEKVADRLLHQVARRGRGSSASPMERLTDRELQIFQLLGKGVRVREIAAQLFLSIKTVESHRVNIKKKLNIKSSAELLRYAIKSSPQAD